MKNLIILITIVFVTFSSCGDVTTVDGVEVSGALHDVMQGKTDASIALSELQEVPNLYALGPVEGLKGEIQIFNSQPVISSMAAEKIEIREGFEDNAAMLVYAQVEEWQEIPVPKPILTMKQFERFMTDSAIKAGVDTSEPFPFLLEGYIRKINWHIVDWNASNAEHSVQAHMNSGMKGIVLEQLVEIIGFYSTSHQGTFTHHGSNVHMHFNCPDIKLAGHVDDLLMGEYMTLKLPK